MKINSSTKDIESGKDLSVNNYIIDTALRMGLFYKADLKRMTREELVKTTVHSETSSHEKMIAEYTQKAKTAKSILRGSALEKELQFLNKRVVYHQSQLAQSKKENYLRCEIAGALFDNLPNGTVQEKRTSFFLNAPDEMKELFGEKYKRLNDEYDQTKKLNKFRELDKVVEKMNDQEKKELLGKKISYEQKNYKYNIQSDRSKRARYEGMIRHVDAWTPEYKNRDQELEQEGEDFFARIKEYAVYELVNDQNIHCNSEKQLAVLGKRHNSKMKILRNIEPADFADRLRYNIVNNINELEKQAHTRQLAINQRTGNK